jgi:predicted dehydrogenase
MEKLQIGIVGLGQRGYGLLKTLLLVKKVEIVAVCDSYADRVEQALATVKEKSGKEAKGYSDYTEMLGDEKVKAVVVATSWDEHIRMAIQSMRAGKITACEVGGAYDIEECWELVRAYEETKSPLMFLENCCFDSFELLSTTLARVGLLGQVVHCHGAYSHDLRDEVLGGNVNRHYRLQNYKKRNCENYPTHEIGPIAKLLDITRGNKFTKLVSYSSKAVGLEEFTTDERNPDKSLIGMKFAQGDIVTTMIECANGETITLTLDTTLPKYYSREFTVRGTKGLCMQEANMVLIDPKNNMHEYWSPELVLGKYLNNAREYEEYMPDLWKNISDEEREAGHGGMDYLMMKTFVNAALNGEEMPIDVYDMATWSSITALSEQSIMLGGASVVVPDFTRGNWIKRESKDVTKLVDKVLEEKAAEPEKE